MTNKPVLQSVSVAFEDAWEQESVALFSLEYGKELPEMAREFILTYNNSIVPGEPTVDRYTAGQLMVKFIQWMKLMGLVEMTYLGMDFNDGNNVTFGHYVVSSVTGQIVRHVEGEIP